MSNHIECPECGAHSADSVWPASGWAYNVTQHAVDRTKGTEDPAAFAQQQGTKCFVCACGNAVWIVERGWFTRVR